MGGKWVYSGGQVGKQGENDSLSKGMATRGKVADTKGSTVIMYVPKKRMPE